MFFHVQRDGHITDLKVAKSSGNSDTDQAAPFDPLPHEYKKDDVPVQFDFDYNVMHIDEGPSRRKAQRKNTHAQWNYTKSAKKQLDGMFSRTKVNRNVLKTSAIQLTVSPQGTIEAVKLLTPTDTPDFESTVTQALQANHLPNFPKK